MYCIVLYLYIYITLLAVHTNQKRFQCERPRDKSILFKCSVWMNEWTSLNHVFNSHKQANVTVVLPHNSRIAPHNVVKGHANDRNITAQRGHFGQLILGCMFYRPCYLRIRVIIKRAIYEHSFLCVEKRHHNNEKMEDRSIVYGSLAVVHH